MDFLLLTDNLPYSLALALVILLGLVEGFSMVFGLSLFGLLDDLTPMEVDADVDTGVSGVTGVAGWLCLDRLPLLIWLVLALTSFAIAGFAINYLAISFHGALPAPLSIPLAIVLGAFSCRILGARLANLLPKNETSAVSVDELSGLVGVVTLGCARKGFPSEAVVKDTYQQKHYVLVEPELAGEAFSQGTSVVLLNRNGQVWSVVQFNDEI
ncbi:YqiJ family protein [Shewanella spartinae]|uniref:YqiJ family protein n=1 Tax=Shewanella spartinae TaxID=2864205 RepID=UPI001C65C0EC|nr:YqiJ family protein [Shewanella spartinae]QYJ94712.1 YqiJ family protein [Shewanella spartinae]